MKVYHGSIIEVAHPLVSLGRRNLDFGKGFYVTDIKEQAQRWAERMGRRKLAAPIVSIYNFEVEKARECCRFSFSMRNTLISITSFFIALQKYKIF